MEANNTVIEESHIYISNEKVFFKKVNGSYFNNITVQPNPLTEEERANVLRLKQKDLSFIDESYKDVYLNCIPAAGYSGEFLPNQEVKHNFLKDALVKCEKSEDEKVVEGFKSGKRSAIIAIPECKEVFIRLKGVGNLTKGFNLQPMVYPPDWLEIRGVQFAHTAFRELYFSQKIKGLLQDHNFLCGNEVIGVWKYSEDISNTENACPKVEKYCGIYKTYGDKRLATNLISGVVTLLQKIITHGIATKILTSKDLDDLKQSFKPSRLNEHNKVKATFTTKIYRDPWKFDKKLTNLEWITQDRIYSDSENEMLLDLASRQQSEELKAKINSLIKLINQEDFQDMNSSLSITLSKELSKLRSQEDFFSALIVLFQRIGFETGYIKRILDENLISWGYFIDHNPFEPHCNAHPNNFLVLDLESPCNKFNALLAPLDFDMAYDFDSFVSIVEDTPDTFGTQDREQFDNWTGLEKYELEAALGGEENMANFSYGGEEQAEKQIEETEALIQEFTKTLEIALRDTCVLSYRQAYSKVSLNQWEEDKWNYKKQLTQINTIVRIALILTDDKET